MNARIIVLQDASVESADLRERDAPETGAADKGLKALILTLEQPIMELTAQQPVARATAVRVDTDEAFWFGEVEQCTPEADNFQIRVRLRHVLRDFETLARLAERFGSPVPERISKGITVSV
jgi:hypothetical protein